ncbi:unnamed protein product [Haemonchus placei]|uniref:C6 domain-containing protein n=1 Tax=Haemonchus placei TaxID=6290 RepID=A0A0N4WVF6_HAEPC|nr:unnamed protein product [Haemonchus placei]
MPQLPAILILVWSTIPVALGCVATSPGANPTTLSPVRTTTPRTVRTTSSATTTARTTTTTVAPVTPLACQTCTVDQVSFDAANGDPGSIDADFRAEANDPQTDCLRLTAICSAQPGFVAFMEFNINQGGPLENQDFVQTVEALLECVDGQWFYRTTDVQEVNSVQCTEFDAAG